MRIFSIIAVFVLVLVHVCGAQADQLAQYKQPHQFDQNEDFYIIEGAGLFQSGSDDALDVDLWHKEERADVTARIKNMPVNSLSPAIQSMIQAILLSESDTQRLGHYTDVKPGEDLLTLRIYKLMQGGFYKDALELYSVAIETPHHTDIAKAGIIAMLGSGEKSIACLEMKTMEEIDQNDDFWSAFTAYCDYTLSETPSKKAQDVLTNGKYDILRSLAFNDTFIFPYTADSFDALSMLEQNILIAERRIEVPVLTPELLADIRPHDIMALLSLKELNDADRLALSVHALDYGLITPQELGDTYKSVSEPEAIMGGVPKLFAQISTEETPEAKRALLIHALNLQEEYGTSALLPFAPYFADTNLSDLTPEQMTRILRIFYRTGEEIPPEMIENYIQNAESKIGDAVFFTSIQAIPLILNIPESHDFSKIMQNLVIFHKNTHNDAENVIENLDNPVTDDDNAGIVYEKGVELTQKEHLMLPEDLRKQLSHKAKAGSLGESVLLSIELLHNAPVKDIDDQAYEEITEALKDVNLKDFSRELAIERLIGN